MFNISKHIWWLLFIYAARYICGLTYHAWCNMNYIWIIVNGLAWNHSMSIDGEVVSINLLSGDKSYIIKR
jgi:hypothetical protein